MVDHLVTEVGFGWAIRISAFMILALLIVGNLAVASRLQPSPRPVTLRQYITPLAEVPYLLTTIASFLFYLGLFLPINYIQVQATTYGMSAPLAAYLIPILNAARYVFQSPLHFYAADVSQPLWANSSRLDWRPIRALQHANCHVLLL